MINGRINFDLKSITFYGVIIICWLENLSRFGREKKVYFYLFISKILLIP